MNFEIANRLAARRRNAGLSQEALADKIGVSRQAVSKWERSESSPDTDNLIALAALYNVSLDELLYGDVVESEASVEPEEVVAEVIDDANEADQNSHANHADSVHVSWDGVHVVDGKGGQVHVSWKDGVHVEDGRKGDNVRVNADGVTINDKHFDSWQEAHTYYHFDKNEKKKNPVASAWLSFPFPLVVIVGYLIWGIAANGWGVGLFLFFLIPAYYIIGGTLRTKKLMPLFCGLYPLAATAWFCYMAFMQNAPHPAWAIFLTIPVVEVLVVWVAKRFKRQRA
ncbi:helix-turn-helix transcriptional regulator [Eggerthellaceae bacterium 3-80]|nr:XRE family transcriptional regulator [bacterium D16-34]